MTEPKIRIRAVDGDHVSAMNVDELIITLPNGIEFSLFPGDDGDDDIVALIKASEPVTPYRFILKPGAVNQISIGAERPPRATTPAESTFAR